MYIARLMAVGLVFVGVGERDENGQRPSTHSSSTESYPSLYLGKLLLLNYLFYFLFSVKIRTTESLKRTSLIIGQQLIPSFPGRAQHRTHPRVRIYVRGCVRPSVRNVSVCFFLFFWWTENEWKWAKTGRDQRVRTAQWPDREQRRVYKLVKWELDILSLGIYARQTDRQTDR